LAVRPRRGGPHPAVTMARGFGGSIHHGLEPFAVTFAEAGFVVLMHDHRGLGRSGGEPPRHTQGQQGRRRPSESSSVRTMRPEGRRRSDGSSRLPGRIPARVRTSNSAPFHLWNFRELFSSAVRDPYPSSMHSHA
jgi:hypothetical protein